MTSQASALDRKSESWKRNIALFLGSQTISLFGSSVVQFAIMWHITLTTKSGVMMMLYIICGFLPTFVLSPVAGVWADRYHRKMLIIAADALIAVTTLILAMIFFLGYEAVWLLFVMAAIRAVGQGIQTPAVGAILPQIVPQDKLMKVNGTNGSLMALNTFLAPIASAGLLSVTTLEMIFLVDVVTAAIAIVILYFLLKIPMHEQTPKPEGAGYFDDFREGLRYVKHHAFLKPFFLFFAIFFILLAPAAFLTPLQVTRSFGEDVWRLTAIEIAFSVGMMAGGGLIAAWEGFRNRMHTMLMASVVMGVCTFLLGVVPNFWIYLGVMALFGVMMPVFNTPVTVVLQEKVDESYLGRVFGVFGMISTSMMPIGMLVFGPVADVIEIEWLLIGTGVLLLALGFLFVRNKRLVEAGLPAAGENVPAEPVSVQE